MEFKTGTFYDKTSVLHFSLLRVLRLVSALFALMGGLMGGH